MNNDVLIKKMKEITSNQLADFITKNTNGICVKCGLNGFSANTTSDTSGILNILYLPVMEKINQGAPFFQLHCNNCGHTELYSAIFVAKKLISEV